MVDAYGTYTLYTQADRSFSNWMDRTDTAVGVRATFLLYDGNRNRSDADATQLTFKSSIAEMAYKDQLITAELKASQEELIHLQDLLSRSEMRVAQASRFLQITVQEYDRGVKNATDVLTAMQVSEEIQRRNVDWKIQYQKTKSDLLARLTTVRQGGHGSRLAE